MSKYIANIIPVLIQIEENFSRLYRNVAQIDGQYNPQLKTVALVLARQETDHADGYRRMIVDLIDSKLSIDDRLFINIQDMLEDFKKRNTRDSYGSIQELLNHAIDFEKRNEQILQKIKASVLASDQSSDDFIRLLDTLILAETSHSDMLDKCMPKDN